MMNESILEVVHESAKDLYKAGVMDAATLRKFDALCLPRPKKYSPQQIQRIRRKNKATQAEFAAYLNASPSTVQKWELGTQKPNGPSLKLLNMVEQKGLQALAR